MIRGKIGMKNIKKDIKMLSKPTLIESITTICLWPLSFLLVLYILFFLKDDNGWEDIF